jgi:putative transposase
MLNVVTNRNCVYQTGYHVIWCPKYRRKILTGHAAEIIHKILTEICKQNCWPILALEIQPDHIHIFLSIPPSLSVANAIKILKGVSARKLLNQFPELRGIQKDKQLWSPSYFVATSGNVSAEIIKKYIERSEHISKRR